MRRVRTGDPLHIPARDYNAMVDAALAHRRATHDAEAGGVRAARNTTVARVLNTTEATVQRFGVLGIGGPLVGPGDNLAAFKQEVILRGVAPATAHLGQFVIALEPIKPQHFGRAVVMGVTVCRVEFPEGGEDLRFADLNLAEEPDAPLLAKGYGPVQILWREPPAVPPVAGIAWCVVRVGNKTTGADFHVKVKRDGGAAGSKTSTCTWTYTVRDLHGNLLGATMTPLKRRDVNAPYTVTPDDTVGTAFYDEAGTFRLFDANETRETEPCENGGS